MITAPVQSIETGGHAAQPPTRWRLIVDEAPRTGAANMAIDQAIAEACAAGEAPATLRFYRWAPPAVSLGRHQPLGDIDAEAARAHGYDIVRRSTGGRAILHTDELTYSVAGSDSDPHLGGGVMESYLRLSGALVRGLRALGLEAVDKAAGTVRAGPNVSAACFEVPSAYEIVVDGRKLLGSAQSRRAGYVLQHGSLPLVGEITRLVEVLALADEERERLRADLAQRACTLRQALGLQEDADAPDFARVAQALAQAFADELALELKPAPLAAAEVRRSAELIRTQFADEAWTAYK
jgi:lipoate-protein ligase A